MLKPEHDVMPQEQYCVVLCKNTTQYNTAQVQYCVRKESTQLHSIFCCYHITIILLPSLNFTLQLMPCYKLCISDNKMIDLNTSFPLENTHAY